MGGLKIALGDLYAIRQHSQLLISKTTLEIIFVTCSIVNCNKIFEYERARKRACYTKECATEGPFLLDCYSLLCDF